MRFKSNHKDRNRIMYKANGGGFQPTELCHDGFIYQVFTRNDPDPQKYMDKYFSLFDIWKEMHHCCTVENLYRSDYFCCYLYKQGNNVTCQGVTRKCTSGINPSVLLEEVKGDDSISVCSTVDKSVLEGNNSCTKLVVISIYNTNPVHYLIMVCEELKFHVNERNFSMWAQGRMRQ